MVFVLITSIINAQTFNFECTSDEVRTAREAQLTALVGQHNVTSMTPFESGADAETLYAAASYTQNGNQITFPLSTEVGLIEDITDWSTKYSELVAKLIADSGIEPTTHAHRAGVLTSYNSIDGISNLEVKVDNPTNLSVATVYLEWDLNGVAQDTYYFSATNPTVDSNGQVPGDLSYYEPGQFETNRERLYNKLIAHIPAGSTTISEANKAKFDALIGQYGVTKITPMERTSPLALIDVEYNQTDVMENGGSTLNFVFSVQYASWASFPQDRFNTKFDEFVAKLKSDDPNYVAATVESELADIFSASTAPTGFVDGGAIETATLIFDTDIESDLRRNFLERLSSANFFVDEVLNNGFETSATLNNGDKIHSPSGGFLHEQDSPKMIAWALEVVQAIYLLENPPAISHADRAAVLTAYNSIDGISNLEVKIINEGFATAYIYLDWDLNGGSKGFNSWYFSSPNPTVSSTGNVLGDLSALSPEQFETYRERLYNYLINSIPAALRAERIAQITALDDASANVVITIVQVENQGEAFRISADPNIVDDFPTGIFETGVTLFERMGDTEWAEMKLRISNRINEIDAAAELAALRTTRIADLEGLDITGVSVAHLPGNDNDTFNVTNPGNQILINADWYGPALVEYHDDEEFADLRDAIIAAREELNPANAIYGFTPSQFQIASLQEKVDKAFDIAKANYDSDGVSGSFVKGIIHGSKITLRVAADNYPLELKPEMAHDADYEGWKTLIDRILYLVKTGDGSERTTRENHINGIAGNISVQDLNGGDDDWAVSWNDLPFIYGGSDENDHNNSYDSNGNTSRVFAGYHQDNIGLLPGIIYEALLIEVDRINGYVIAADALRRHTDGGYNKEREMGLKALLTGNATFDENMYAEWIILNSDVTVWTNSKYGPICDVPGYLWLGVMDNYSFRYMYIIVRNELLRNADGTRYYNNVNQNIYCN